MKIEQITYARDLLESTRNLQRYKELFSSKDRELAHFSILQHYGEIFKNDVIDIPRKYNERFIKLVDEIIKEINSEIESL